MKHVERNWQTLVSFIPLSDPSWWKCSTVLMFVPPPTSVSSARRKRLRRGTNSAVNAHWDTCITQHDNCRFVPRYFSLRDTQGNAAQRRWMIFQEEIQTVRPHRGAIRNAAKLVFIVRSFHRRSGGQLGLIFVAIPWQLVGRWVWIILPSSNWMDLVFFRF